MELRYLPSLLLTSLLAPIHDDAPSPIAITGILKCRMFLIVLTLLAPEVLILCLIDQWHCAREIMETISRA